MRLLVIFFCLSASISIWAACPINLAPEYKISETVTLKKINDGDTVTLNNGQLLRFIGINTPEINHQDKSLSEPYSLQAKQLLEKHIQVGDKLHLVFDQTRFDKYGRLLAYPFNDSGENLSLLQLQSGLAKHWVIGRNDLFWQCFQVAEQIARLNKQGAWTDFKPLDAEDLSVSNTGYQYVTGEISEYERTDKRLLIVLDNQLKVFVNKRYFPLFGQNNKTFSLHQKLLIRGRVKHNDNGFYLTLYHPSQILP